MRAGPTPGRFLRREVPRSPDLQVDAAGRVSTKQSLGAGDYLLTVAARGRPAGGGRIYRGCGNHRVAAGLSRGARRLRRDDVVGASSRHVTLDAASGYFGRGYAIPVSANYTLSGEVYDSNKLGYDEVNKVITILSGNRVPSSGELTLTLSGDGGCDDGIRTCLTVPVSVTAVFRAVESPAQVGAEADYLRGFTVGLNLPQGYAAGENQPGRGLSLIVSEALSNVSLSLGGATDELAYAPDGVASDALSVGAYTVTVALTATGLLGTVLMEFAATVRALDLDSADYGLPQPEEVTVASGYTGYLHTDISLGASAADGVLSALSGAFPSGVSLSLLSDSRGVAAHLTQGLDGVSFRPEVTLTVSRGANYNPLEQIATLLVTALPTPPTASASGETFGFSASFEGNVVDLADAGYEEGAYSGGRFEETSSADLSVAANGQVSARKKLGVGDYLLTVTVRGRPDSRASADAFIGDATITVSLRVEQGSEAIAADDVVGASSRHVTLDAAAGYFGRGYAIPVEANYTLSGEVYDSGELGYDDVNKVITILSGNRVPSSGELTLTLSGDGGCGDGIRTCPTVPVTVTAVFGRLSRRRRRP